MTAAAPAPPPLDAGLEQLLRRTNGDSIRLTQALSGKGVIPLN